MEYIQKHYTFKPVEGESNPFADAISGGEGKVDFQSFKTAMKQNIEMVRASMGGKSKDISTGLIEVSDRTIEGYKRKINIR